MKPLRFFATSHRHHRLKASLEEVLTGIDRSIPLYLHARNWMAEMASITRLGECIYDQEDQQVFFPEQGLHLSHSAVECMHAVTIEHRSLPSLALEIATPGEPRAVSIAAIPSLGEHEAFTRSVMQHPADPLVPEIYHHWRTLHGVAPEICPCCEEEARQRRARPADHALSRIFQKSIQEGVRIDCQIESPAFVFSRSLTPGELFFSGGHIRLTSREGASLLEVDPGFCHALALHRTCVDAEPITELRAHNSRGVRELTIRTRGWDAYAHWLRLCL